MACQEEINHSRDNFQWQRIMAAEPTRHPVAQYITNNQYLTANKVLMIIFLKKRGMQFLIYYFQERKEGQGKNIQVLATVSILIAAVITILNTACKTPLVIIII